MNFIERLLFSRPQARQSFELPCDESTQLVAVFGYVAQELGQQQASDNPKQYTSFPNLPVSEHTQHIVIGCFNDDFTIAPRSIYEQYDDGVDIRFIARNALISRQPS